jgi:hypothetical protein
LAIGNNIRKRLINYGYLQHIFNANNYKHILKKGKQEEFKSENDYLEYEAELLNNFYDFAGIARVNMAGQKEEFELFKSDKRFADLSLIDKIEKLRANCRLAFGKIYERLAIDILKYVFSKENVKYNNSNGRNIIDLSFTGDKKIFDIEIFSDKYNKFVGADVKYCTKYFNAKYDGKNIFYNTCFTKDKLLEMAKFHEKQDNNSFIDKSYLLVIVPTMTLTSEDYKDYKRFVDPGNVSVNDFMFVVYLDKFITDSGNLIQNIDDYIMLLPKSMWKDGKKVYGINRDTDAVHTISEFVDDVINK